MRDSRFKEYVKVEGEFGWHGFVVDKKTYGIPERKMGLYGSGKSLLPVVVQNKVPIRYTTTEPVDDWMKSNFDDHK